MPRRKTTKAKAVESKSNRLDDYTVRQLNNAQMQKYVQETGCTNSEARSLFARDLVKPGFEDLTILTKELKILNLETFYNQ